MNSTRICLFTENGHLVVPDRPGWGTEPNEEALKKYPPVKAAGMIYRVPRLS